ncbi:MULTISPECIES: DUF4114 domain-containing protein [Calothrix]|uniref:DUF4114 domain-containing protein n=2 Tax=Calothrix TaxID=1186 RepID=A0ABR8A5B2_9CYAN|nr:MULTISPECIES: DUF4114 domain-containing protein [Calothrix]MBD2195155.1 DUF4114 domain-containing protein [Calothrix parietina FACHB-288]MBD2223874.1 DUF4114 domain-containing protein [Calothrix anomala FACHB-343]
MAIINGTSGIDELLATGSGNTLNGLQGNDIIDGSSGEGNNILEGNEGDDEIFAKTNDTAKGGSGKDTIQSIEGMNILYGGDDDDLIFPYLKDQVFAEAGNDTIYAGLGDSTLTGGLGNDIFWIANNEYLQAPNIIADFDPTADSLKVELEGVTRIADLTLQQQGSDTLISKNSKALAIVKNTNVDDILNGGNSQNIKKLLVDSDNIFTVSATRNTKIKLKAKLISNQANSVNEVGFFVVKDNKGTIIDSTGKSYTPADGDVYIQVALKQSLSLFSSITNRPNGFNNIDISRIIEKVGGDRLVFYFIENGTTDGAVKGRIPLSRVTLGSKFGNGSSDQFKVNDLGNNQFNLAWGQDKMVLSFSLTDESVPLGTNLQGGNPAELIDLRNVAGTVKADFSVFREAAYNNEVYFYKVDNADGLIGNIDPANATTANYLQAAINNLIKDQITGELIKLATPNQGTQTTKATVAAGSILAPLIVINGSLSQLTDVNTNNDPQVYFPYLGVNADGVDHIRLLGNNTFGFEDLPGGGDLDYNDVIININFSTNT